MTKHTPINWVLLHRTYTEEQVLDLWYDWFCKDTSLENKGRRLLAKLRTISPSTRFDMTKTYVFFKNNCPMYGSLYDDFRICDIVTGDVLYCVVPAEGYERTKGQAVVNGKAPDTGEFEELVRGTWRDVKEFFHATEAGALQIVQETRRLNMILQAEREYKQFLLDRRCETNPDRQYAECFEAFIAR